MRVLNDDIIKDNLDIYYSYIKHNSNTRFRSWEHCYCIFNKLKDVHDEETIDYLSLHLSFYLASWGMYRGSSFLLQKDYKVHIPAIKIMKKDKYKILYGIDIETLVGDKFFTLLQEVIQELREYYASQKDSVKNTKTDVSDTLITKILLGVYGCVPAFDRMLCGAIKKYNICSRCITKKQTYIDLLKFYKDHEVIIEAKREIINKNGIIYPQMKMIDIIFWQIGFDEGL